MPVIGKTPLALAGYHDDDHVGFSSAIAAPCGLEAVNFRLI